MILVLLLGGAAFLASGRPAAAQGASSFRRGDADGSGSILLTDAVVVLNFLFLGGRPPVCMPVADADGEGGLNITDGVYILGFLFFGSAAPPPLTQEEINTCRGLTPELIARGMEVFSGPDPEANTFFSCSVCHGLYEDPAQEPFLYSGHTLLNAQLRPSWKSGRLTNFLDAVNVCRNDWMVARLWEEESPDYLALKAFLASLETQASVPALVFTIVAPSVSGPAATGNVEDGCRLFNRSCSICHGEGGVGGGEPPLAVSLVDPRNALLDNPDFIRRRIRLSGPPGSTSVYQFPVTDEERIDAISVMPFWSREKLADQQVEDLVAFVARAREEARAGNTTFECPDDPQPVDGNVVRRGVTRLGEVGPRQHGVDGIVEELDTRRIRLTDFSYDGRGARVRVWLYQSSGNIRDGMPIGPDITENDYHQETLVVDIPPEITSDMFDAVSIWCLSAGSSFGQAVLGPAGG